MSSFEKRLAKGAELQQHLLDYLDEQGVEYLLSGYEHLQGSKGARKCITKNSDTTSLFIRHYPDVSLISPSRSVLIEVKNSTGIEKDCFNAYLKLKEEMGLHVLLFLKNKRLCHIDDIKFSRMDCRDFVAGFDVPVTHGIWKEPRKMDDLRYQAYLNAYRARRKYTSGCSFAFINFEESRTYPLSALAHSIKKPAGGDETKPAGQSLINSDR